MIDCKVRLRSGNCTVTPSCVGHANALRAGCIDVIELTLRTDLALVALRAICDNVPDTLVGVGTILSPKSGRVVKDVGASFGVSLGYNPKVVWATQEAGLPFATRISTPSDLEWATEQGGRLVKFFLAESAGGIACLRSMDWGAMVYVTRPEKAFFVPLNADGDYNAYQIKSIVDRVDGGDAFAGGLILR